MSAFARLMAISKAHTDEQQHSVQAALEQRQRNEEKRRKEQEERDRKDKEIEEKMRKKYFEDKKKEEERKERLKKEREAQAAMLKKREDEQRDALLYGPKKAKSNSSSGSKGGSDVAGTSKWPQSRATAHRSRTDDDDDMGNASMALTREEKRERKLQAELARTYQTSKGRSKSNGYIKSGRRLPGGAVDITSPAGTTSASTGNDSGASSANQGVRARLSAMPNTLTKLNVVKRDTRTIDEILRDRAKARESKVLEGEEAKEFSDWFSKPKKREPVQAPTATSSPAPPASTSTLQLSSSKPSVSTLDKSTANKQSSHPSLSKSSNKLSTTSTLAKNPRSALTNPSKYTSTSKTPAASKHSTSASASSRRPKDISNNKKRPRSQESDLFSDEDDYDSYYSDDESPARAPKRQRPGTNAGPSGSALSNEIWKLFGKDRGRYVARDVDSDDEDMEVDARILEREERQSALLAKKEDLIALEEEKRHEEEKRRKRTQKGRS